MKHNFKYSRRYTTPVRVGLTTIGGDAPIRIQSMTNTPSLDVDASAEQCIRIADAGADIVRLTAQGVAHAQALGKVREVLRSRGVDTPLVADIHFNPAAAFAAAEVVEKVRINPGNFVDPGRTFKSLSYTDEEYAAEIEKIRQKFVPFLDLCRKHNTAIRIGVNHGSLSDRIMSRYGDTPAGMVESAMEFLRICVAEQFTDVVISIKASNVNVMVETVRRMVAAMDAEDMHFPLHLGVTEAGDGEDGRVKSAVGIGSLLADGIGDTIRVSLSEAPENEIPVAKALVKHIENTSSVTKDITCQIPDDYSFITPIRRSTDAVGIVGGDNVPVAIGVDFDAAHIPAGVNVFSTHDGDGVSHIMAKIFDAWSAGDKTPVIAHIKYDDSASYDHVTIAAACDFGRLLLARLIDGIWIEAPSLTQEQINSLSLSILQATRSRMSKTEYIACPGCGRTLFDLQHTLQEIKAATSHLKGLKIGVMGCIVNGPGEMADADYGYVGAGTGNVSLYKGKTCIIKNIPASEAITHLIQLIKENGDWKDNE